MKSHFCLRLIKTVHLFSEYICIYIYIYIYVCVCVCEKVQLKGLWDDPDTLICRQLPWFIPRYFLHVPEFLWQIVTEKKFSFRIHNLFATLSYSKILLLHKGFFLLNNNIFMNNFPLSLKVDDCHRKLSNNKKFAKKKTETSSDFTFYISVTNRVQKILSSNASFVRRYLRVNFAGKKKKFRAKDVFKHF